jgi:hypothetical protein
MSLVHRVQIGSGVLPALWVLGAPSLSGRRTGREADLWPQVNNTWCYVSGTYSTGGWVGPWAELDALEKEKTVITAGNWTSVVIPEFTHTKNKTALLLISHTRIMSNCSHRDKNRLMHKFSAPVNMESTFRSAYMHVCLSSARTIRKFVFTFAM